MIQFLLNQITITVKEGQPTLSLLDWLRKNNGLVGTKEGCASGDCGACTLLVGERVVGTDGMAKWHYKAINSCLMLLGNAHGKHILTIEALTSALQPRLADLHPVQKALVECHGSQCGFCTPGIVMSLLALYLNNETYPGKTAVIHALGGNLCRCTGYSPILKAAEKAFEYPRSQQPWSAMAENFKQKQLSEQIGQSVPELKFKDGRFYLPQSIDQLLVLKSQQPQARLVAGGTDIAIEFSQNLANPTTLISVAQVSELTQVTDDGQILSIGAAATYDEFVTLFCSEYPEAKELFERLGSLQIRNSGTLGGSLGNASPIGDPAPLLIALGATIELSSLEACRTIKVEDFFTGYRQTSLAANEVITKVNVPKRSTALKLAIHKVSKRFEDDISTVCLVLALEQNNGVITAASCVMGGMAATPARAKQVEQQLLGARLEQQSFHSAGQAIALDFTPMSDVRASAEYRLEVSKNLLVRIGYQFCQPIDAGEGLAQPTKRIAHASL